MYADPLVVNYDCLWNASKSNVTVKPVLWAACTYGIVHPYVTALLPWWFLLSPYSVTTLVHVKIYAIIEKKKNNLLDINNGMCRSAAFFSD